MAPWKEVAILEQQHFLQIFGSTDWDLYRPEEKKLLSDKVGLVIFGPPRSQYDRTQVTRIKEVTDAIVREGVHGSPDGIWMSIVIVFVKPPKDDYYCHPVFRVPKYSDGSDRRHAFIDCIGRVYKSWIDFLKNNKLPKSEICYPVDGVYRQDVFGNVVIDFAQCKSKLFLKVVDGASNLVAFGSMGVAAAALALPVAAPLVTAVTIGSAVSGIYGAARATQDQVDRKRHGQSVGLTNMRSVGNWGNIVGGLVGIGSGIRCLQLSRGLSKTAKLGATVGALRAPSATPREMLRDIRAKAMLLQDLSAHVLLMCHTVADNLHVADFLNSDDRNNVLHLKSKLFTMVERGEETVCCLEFIGFESEELQEVLSKGICEYSCKSQLSFSCSVEMFRGIKQYILDCIDRNLTGLSLEDVKVHMKVIIDFFANHDFTWVIVLCQKVLLVTNISPRGEALLGIIAGLYFFLKKVVDMAQSGRNVSFSQLKPTQSDIIEIFKICVFDDCSFLVKFGKLYESFIKARLIDLLEIRLGLALQNYIDSPNMQNLNSVSEEEVLKAASDLVGSRLDVSNAKVTHGKDEIYVIITDRNIEVSVVEIVPEKESGRVSAKVLR